MSSTTTRSQIGSDDIKWWDGVTNTFTRLTSTGGTLTLNAIGSMVDVLESYGGGTSYTDTTLANAIAAMGTTNKRDLLLRPGTWVIDADLTIPSNFRLFCPPGATLAVATACTLTINGPIEAGPYQIFSLTGTGAVSIDGNSREIWASWWGVSTASADNSAALKAAIDACAKGMIIKFPQGVFTFTASAVDGVDMEDGIIFKGAGTDHDDLTRGTVLKYTAATGWLFNPLTPDAIGERGWWGWCDLTIYLTNAGADGGILLNDTTSTNPGLVTTPQYCVQCFLKNVTIHGTASAGVDAPDGFVSFGMFNSKVDENCHFDTLRRAVWIRDGDGNTIRGRYIYCNQSVRIENVGGTHSNCNDVSGMFHYCVDYGDDRYVWYDTGNKTHYHDCQQEPGQDDSPWYFNGLYTVVSDIQCTKTDLGGAAAVANAGVIGPAARFIQFIRCMGMFESLAATTWPKVSVDDTGLTGPYSSYSNKRAYFIDCDMAFVAQVPKHPRLQIGNFTNSQYPDPAGLTGDELWGVGGISTPWDGLRSLGLGRHGMTDLERVDFFGHALNKNFVGGYNTNSGATYIADADARHGYAIKLTNLTDTSTQMIGYPYVVGRNVGITDAIRWHVKCRLDAVPVAGTMYIQLYNLTTTTAIGGQSLGVSTTFTTQTGVFLLNSALVSADDVIYLGIYNNTGTGEGINMHVSEFYGGVMPRITDSQRYTQSRLTVAYAAAITPDLTKGGYIFVNLAANVAITVNAPTSPIAGERIVFEFLNAAGACAITWNAVFKANYVSVTASKTAVVEFVYNGTNWLQVGTVAELT